MHTYWVYIHTWDPERLANHWLYMFTCKCSKLQKDLFNPKKGTFDLSKIPDVYDCIKFDILHNDFLRLRDAAPLYTIVRAFADIVVSQEYGIDAHEKADIGMRIAHHLLHRDWDHSKGARRRGDGGFLRGRWGQEPCIGRFNA